MRLSPLHHMRLNRDCVSDLAWRLRDGNAQAERKQDDGENADDVAQGHVSCPRRE